MYMKMKMNTTHSHTTTIPLLVLLFSLSLLSGDCAKVREKNSIIIHPVTGVKYRIKDVLHISHNPKLTPSSSSNLFQSEDDHHHNEIEQHISSSSSSLLEEQKQQQKQKYSVFNRINGYKLLNKKGSGGFGAVYSAQKLLDDAETADPSGTLYAVKEEASDLTGYKSFLNFPGCRNRASSWRLKLVDEIICVRNNYDRNFGKFAGVYIPPDPTPPSSVSSVSPGTAPVSPSAAIVARDKQLQTLQIHSVNNLTNFEAWIMQKLTASGERFTPLVYDNWCQFDIKNPAPEVTWFTVMELFTGSLSMIQDVSAYTSLSEILKQSVMDSIKQQMIQSIAHVHKQGFVHRDIKPPNFLYRFNGSNITVVLADFGIARLEDDYVFEMDSLNQKCCATRYVSTKTIQNFDIDNGAGTQGYLPYDIYLCEKPEPASIQDSYAAALSMIQIEYPDQFEASRLVTSSPSRSSTLRSGTYTTTAKKQQWETPPSAIFRRIIDSSTPESATKIRSAYADLFNDDIAVRCLKWENDFVKHPLYCRKNNIRPKSEPSAPSNPVSSPPKRTKEETDRILAHARALLDESIPTLSSDSIKLSPRH